MWLQNDGSRSPGRLLSLWIIAAVVLGTGLALERWSRESLDDPNPAYQRPGVLVSAGTAPTAPDTALDLVRPGRRAVIFFVRTAGRRTLEKALDHWSSPPDVDVKIVADDAGLGQAYGLRRPRDGGTPVGYAVIDKAGRIRYVTLDPHPARHLVEVETILDAM